MMKGGIVVTIPTPKLPKHPGLGITLKQALELPVPPCPSQPQPLQAETTPPIRPTSSTAVCAIGKLSVNRGLG